MSQRRFQDLKVLRTFDERYEYLKLKGKVGQSTFGFDRYLNQSFYKSREWRSIRDAVILRDGGCDLGIIGREIHDKILVHHMNPISLNDIDSSNPDLLNPDFLICTSNQTHQAIHYGNINGLFQLPKKRAPGDTKLW